MASRRVGRARRQKGADFLLVGRRQTKIHGRSQCAGRVGFFLRVDDFESTYERLAAAGVSFVTAPRVEAYGSVAVFLDLAGNRWDLLGNGPRAGATPELT